MTFTYKWNRLWLRQRGEPNSREEWILGNV